MSVMHLASTCTPWLRLIDCLIDYLFIEGPHILFWMKPAFSAPSSVKAPMISQPHMSHSFMIFDDKCKNNDEVSIQPKDAYLELAWDDLRDAEACSLPTTSYPFQKTEIWSITNHRTWNYVLGSFEGWDSFSSEDFNYKAVSYRQGKK